MILQTKLSDVKQLAEIASDIDFANAAGGAKPAVTELVEKLHNTIASILGQHASLVYAPDDGSEYDPKN